MTDDTHISRSPLQTPLGWQPIGTPLRKKRGSQWRGRVVGFYATKNTPVGYAIESAFEPGSVQVWPADALEFWDELTP